MIKQTDITNAAHLAAGVPRRYPAYTQSMDTLRKKVELDTKYGRANWASLPKKAKQKLKRKR